ncbi:hypothetical protein Tco_1534209, partial [Tanacetum coccineum]
LKNDLSKVKGKDIVDNVAQVSNATTIAPGMYKLDPVILAPKVKNNRKAHEYYLKHNMEQAAILREVVEQAKSQNPLDSASYSACMYVKLIQGLLGYVRDVCPSNIPKETNRPLSSSIGVNPSTSTSKSKPLGNIKNDRIPQTPSSNEKNKVEVQSRLTATNKVPLTVPIPLEVVAPKHVVTRVYTRRPEVPMYVQNSKPKVAKSMTANRMEPGTSRGSDTLVALSSSSLIDCMLSKWFCGI